MFLSSRSLHILDADSTSRTMTMKKKTICYKIVVVRNHFYVWPPPFPSYLRVLFICFDKEIFKNRSWLYFSIILIFYPKHEKRKLRDWRRSSKVTNRNECGMTQTMRWLHSMERVWEATAARALCNNDLLRYSLVHILAYTKSLREKHLHTFTVTVQTRKGKPEVITSKTWKTRIQIENCTVNKLNFISSETNKIPTSHDSRTTFTFKVTTRWYDGYTILNLNTYSYRKVNINISKPCLTFHRYFNITINTPVIKSFLQNYLHTIIVIYYR